MIIKQSPYSPDLNQCDRWVFKDLKKHLRQYGYSSAEEIQEKTLQFMRQLPPERFPLEIQRFHKHCKSVIECRGDYVT